MLYELTIPQFSKMLLNLSNLLKKAEGYAETKKFDMDVLMKSRIAPDMFPLAKQIQIACDAAKLCAARLTGKDAPVHDDTKESYADLKTRIQETIAFLGTIQAKDFNAGAEKQITQPRWEGKWLTGQDYVINHATPNVYFHVTTAYAILRGNGVDIGKKDFLGELPFKK